MTTTSVNVTASGNDYIDGVLCGTKWSDGTPASTTISYYIAGVATSNERMPSADNARATTAAQEVTAFELAMQLIADVCNINFVAAGTQASATIAMGAVNDSDAYGALGWAYYPGDVSSTQTAYVVNYDAYYTNDYSSLQIGGYDFVTFIHELGHTLGLKHPFDTGLTSDFQPFPGVTSTYDRGDYNLNQGVYTMMSYNDGYETGPMGPLDIGSNPTHGWEGTPMAFDVAALQYLYGANMNYRTGNNVYVLPTANAAGAYYSCIWDAGGTDTIKAGSGANCTIDLRAATLTAANGGGGFISAQDGIYGGFTIANGVVIEKAIGAGGNDKLFGNGTANVLRGEGGDDVLKGLSGNDRLVGGDGHDQLVGGPGRDFLVGGASSDTFVFASINQSSVTASDFIADFQVGVDKVDLGAIDANSTTAGVDDAFTFIDQQQFHGVAGELRYVTNAAHTRTIVLGDTDGDGVKDFRIVFKGDLVLHDTDFIL